MIGYKKNMIHVKGKKREKEVLTFRINIVGINEKEVVPTKNRE